MKVEDFEKHYTDLVNERVGGRALHCSDEWFAACANLVKNDAPIFRQGHFVATGQWMDGWESRRSYGRRERAESGLDHDWCILRLGIAGAVHGVDVETTHFTGNAPLHASLEGAWTTGKPDSNTDWFPLLERSPTNADAHNVFSVTERKPCTHIRLKIFPDGGVARLRVWGRPLPRAEHYLPGEPVDLASVMLGGRSQQCSNMFYSSPNNLLMPNPGVNMGDGWETKRRRDDDYDWCIIRLGVTGSIRKVIVDTAHFLGNYPDHITLEATQCENEFTDDTTDWVTVLDRLPLEPDFSHLFLEQVQVPADQKFTHVRLKIFPDGGVSRLRIIGDPDWSSAA